MAFIDDTKAAANGVRDELARAQMSQYSKQCQELAGSLKDRITQDASGENGRPQGFVVYILKSEGGKEACFAGYARTDTPGEFKAIQATPGYSELTRVCSDLGVSIRMQALEPAHGADPVSM